MAGANPRTTRSPRLRVAPDLARRRLLRAGVIGAPLVITLASRPAYGAVQWSAGISANMQSNVATRPDGHTPAYWVAHKNTWPGGYNYKTYFACAFTPHDGHGPLSGTPGGYGVPWVYFPTNGAVPQPDLRLTLDNGTKVKVSLLTLWQVINTGLYGLDAYSANVGAHAVAALLNSVATIPYPMSEAGVKTVFGRGYGDLAGDWVSVAGFFTGFEA